MRGGPGGRHARRCVCVRISRISVLFVTPVRNVVVLRSSAPIAATLCRVLSRILRVPCGRSHVLVLGGVEESRVIPGIVTGHPARQMLIWHGITLGVTLVAAGGGLTRCRGVRMLGIVCLAIWILSHDCGGESGVECDAPWCFARPNFEGRRSIELNEGPRGPVTRYRNDPLGISPLNKSVAKGKRMCRKEELERKLGSAPHASRGTRDLFPAYSPPPRLSTSTSRRVYLIYAYPAGILFLTTFSCRNVLLHIFDWIILRSSPRPPLQHIYIPRSH